MCIYIYIYMSIYIYIYIYDISSLRVKFHKRREIVLYLRDFSSTNRTVTKRVIRCRHFMKLAYYRDELRGIRKAPVLTHSYISDFTRSQYSTRRTILELILLNDCLPN